mmetsp:Transcript_24124/g.43500  ORF Transcript_24124/g.43500 Transcript_24124/m.43500 type:complete len:266 (+) Transcript_24124:1634-2431(+)
MQAPQPTGSNRAQPRAAWRQQAVQDPPPPVPKAERHRRTAAARGTTPHPAHPKAPAATPAAATHTTTPLTLLATSHTRPPRLATPTQTTHNGQAALTAKSSHTRPLGATQATPLAVRLHTRMCCSMRRPLGSPWPRPTSTLLPSSSSWHNRPHRLALPPPSSTHTRPHSTSNHSCSPLRPLSDRQYQKDNTCGMDRKQRRRAPRCHQFNSFSSSGSVGPYMGPRWPVLLIPGPVMERRQVHPETSLLLVICSNCTTRTRPLTSSS